MKAEEERARILAGVSGAPPSVLTRFDGKGGKMGQRPKGGVVAHHAAQQVGKRGGASAKGLEKL